jgi:hypothetical protein
MDRSIQFKNGNLNMLWCTIFLSYKNISMCFINLDQGPKFFSVK